MFLERKEEWAREGQTKKLNKREKRKREDINNTKQKKTKENKNILLTWDTLSSRRTAWRDSCNWRIWSSKIPFVRSNSSAYLFIFQFYKRKRNNFWRFKNFSKWENPWIPFYLSNKSFLFFLSLFPLFPSFLFFSKNLTICSMKSNSLTIELFFKWSHNSCFVF